MLVWRTLLNSKKPFPFIIRGGPYPSIERHHIRTYIIKIKKDFKMRYY